MYPEKLAGIDSIYIAGDSSFINEALSYVLEREVHQKCYLLKNGEKIPPMSEDLLPHKTLILINCPDRDFEAELTAFGITEKSPHEGMATALFNLKKGTGIERRAVNKGITGFFYRSDPLGHIVKGVQALIRGEIWVSRDILIQAIFKGPPAGADTPHEKSALTHRETEILALVSIGATNDDIADRLFIIHLTVKTHLYKIFQKIKVPNRFQAALWAAKNL
jgi:DNA-binding NarL/FixJ family response regulator